MASPQQRPDLRERPPDDRPREDMGYSRVQQEVGKGRPFAWWWIVVLVIVAAIVWWGGWGHRNTTPAPTTHKPAPTVPAGPIAPNTGPQGGQNGSGTNTGATTAPQNQPH